VNWAPRSRAAGLLLREYREFAGYSRFALGERVGISADQLERWEIVGVPVPPPERALALAGLLDIPQSAIDAAFAGDAARGGAVIAFLRRLPRDPVEKYEAVPELEDAIVSHGWTAEEVAEALGTSPTKIQAWRLGVIEMTHVERLALSDLVRLKRERAGE
jgi:transcriptional regulator with XRE-family HTH domain